jgi:hypothetical protein
VLDVGVERVDRVGLPFEVIAYPQRREEDETARVFSDRVQDRRRAVSRKAGPQQEHGIDPVQARVQSAWGGQVTAHDVHAAR